jgi:hypothetical protein
MSPREPFRGKIFGIGLSRTGTTSLHHALRRLGYRSVHMPLRALRMRKGVLSLDMERVARYDALNDTIISRFYPELDRAFPGAKFILTTRDRERWLRSCETYPWWLGKYYPGPHKINRLNREIYGAIRFDRDAFARAYDQHHAEVAACFADRPGDLLVLNIPGGEGWGKLCDFLGHPRPAESFPRSNAGYHRLANELCRRLALPAPFHL